ncbi:hypothetical protein HKBW3S33_00516 [Candidatus Hakubella thermalkaliphila]|uniref:Uncharacterized protein n=1 Tax=Candidatus Hakubella thermalkaliphila TaxID=2754717 RepID=A0A6V8P653_9ACTN|nr:hypothetical protein HKBW3S33_00516 [Candidatus Hakubella thermalkaliphila]
MKQAASPDTVSPGDPASRDISYEEGNLHRTRLQEKRPA